MGGAVDECDAPYWVDPVEHDNYQSVGVLLLCCTEPLLPHLTSSVQTPPCSGVTCLLAALIDSLQQFVVGSDSDNSVSAGSRWLEMENNYLLKVFMCLS